MSDKTSTGRMSYQGHGSNNRREFVRGNGNTYGRGQGCGFNPTKTKVWVKYEALGSGMSLIGYARQED